MKEKSTESSWSSNSSYPWS